MQYNIGVYKVVKDYTRDTQGKFATLPWRKWKKRMLITIMVVSGLIIGGGMATDHYGFLERWFVPLEYVAAQRAEAAELSGTIDEMKNDVLNRLMACESGDRTGEDAYGLITYDPDKSGKDHRIPSFGQFQFKVPTIQHYYKKMTGTELTQREAVAIAFDPMESRKLASWVVFDSEKGGSNDWVICYERRDLETLVRFIKAHN